MVSSEGSTRQLEALGIPRTTNVVLVGERGVGKSSIVNLIAQKEIASVSSDASGGTTEYQRYEISFDDMDLALFDTVGLEEPQLGINVNSNAMEEACELIDTLRAAGGVHLVLFCMRGRRLNATTRSNYQLIRKKLCDTGVPIALVFTHLESEEDMEAWCERNRSAIESYGFESDIHGITTVQGDTPEGKAKYIQSQEIIRTLLRAWALQGQTLRGTLLQTRTKTFNVVVIGERGVGKSSVINLIAQKEIAKVSSDVGACTLQHRCYNVSFDNMSFAIFDTVGLEEAQMGVNGYLEAIKNAYRLIVRLGATGGIHLILFCMRAGQIKATTRSNYRLFYEYVCNARVAIALVFTGLEREDTMEAWWGRNESGIQGYGIKSDGHACITAVQDDAPEGKAKYIESQETIRQVLKTCILKRKAFSLESRSWFTRTLMGLKSFVPARRSPKKEDVMKVLTDYCKLDTETAKRIIDMMEKGDIEKNGLHTDEGREEVVKNLKNDDAVTGVGPGKYPDVMELLDRDDEGSSELVLLDNVHVPVPTDLV